MNITFIPENITAEFAAGDTIAQAAQRVGVELRTDCGSMGKCGKCKVTIRSKEKCESVLACQCKAEDGMVVERLPEREEAERKNILLHMPEQCMIDREEKSIGIAVDIGTTTVVVMALSLEDGALLGTLSAANPQRKYGADVISRIAFASEASYHTRLLQQMVTGCIGQLVREILQQVNLSEKQISRYAVVGNTTMSHLFLGFDPSGLGETPFSPVFMHGREETASSLGLPGRENAAVYVASNMAGHVGSDITADLLGAEMIYSKPNRLIVDIGTNGEILLQRGDRILVCSTAAGPAFEGGAISCGMRAAAGAIEKVNLTGGRIELTVIGNGVPSGICGSGIIDAVSQMLKQGILDESGRILSQWEVETSAPAELRRRIRSDGEVNRFVLFEDEAQGRTVAVTQNDIRQVQMAKAAVSAGIRILLKEQKLKVKDLAQVCIAGAFGSYIDIESAVSLGLLPDIEAEKITALGNGAGMGACMMTLSAVYREKAEDLALRTEHIELAEEDGFLPLYLEAMNFSTRKGK